MTKYLYVSTHIETYPDTWYRVLDALDSQKSADFIFPVTDSFGEKMRAIDDIRDMIDDFMDNYCYDEGKSDRPSEEDCDRIDHKITEILKRLR